MTVILLNELLKFNSKISPLMLSCMGYIYVCVYRAVYNSDFVPND